MKKKILENIFKYSSLASKSFPLLLHRSDSANSTPHALDRNIQAEATS